MPINALNCHSEERSRPQAGVATRNLLFHRNLARTVHFVGNDMLYILAKRIFQ